MTITFIGHGYVGLVTACVFADFGNTVWVIGHTSEKIERLKKGDPLIFEPGLQEMLKKNLEKKRLRFTLDYQPAVTESEVIFITVGTPPKKNGEADLSAVQSVAENIGKNLRPGLTVVSCKSTVPVGTNLEVEAIINRVKPINAEVAVASCPEFLREGTALYDTLNPDRVVIGSDKQEAVDLLLNVHKPLPGKRVITDLSSAELIKYTANAMLATKISFANLIAFYCEKTGADVEMVLDAVGLDKRIGRVFMYPGVGYGGSCLPKDVAALTQTGKSLGIDTTLFDGVEKVNQEARKLFVEKILRHTHEKTIALWGLSFKPDTDDIRFAPSLYIIEQLLRHNYRIHVYDPEAIDNIRKHYGTKLIYAKTPYEALEGAHALAVLTEWNEFKQVDLSEVKRRMKTPLIFDGRNMYDPAKMQHIGFTYYSVGRKSIQL